MNDYTYRPGANFNEMFDSAQSPEIDIDIKLLNDIQDDLRFVLSELKEIETGLRTEFRGIGTEQCADHLHQIAEQYRNLQTRLRELDKGYCR